jgi:hypothetical protein
MPSVLEALTRVRLQAVEMKANNNTIEENIFRIGHIMRRPDESIDE